ncbi:MAG: efflux RND transporter periplasmic adaptor subunit [Gammaproteobacteria bacterium]
MKERLSMNGRRVALAAVLLPLLLAFLYTGLRAGPLAPVEVTVARVESAAITPSLFGIGTVEARYRFRIGPTVPGRVLRIDVQPGDVVAAGQVLGEMDPVDLDERLASLAAGVRRADAAVALAIAQQGETRARADFARAQAARYEELFARGLASADSVDAKRQERDITVAAQQATEAGIEAARADSARLRADLDALRRQRHNLQLRAPVAGLVSRRDADPGTTLVAGQAAVEVIDPQSVWVQARFDQQGAGGLAVGQPARIALRSRPGETLSGRVARVEPQADAVTEELIARIDFAPPPAALPPLGELAEITVELAPLPAHPVVSNAALRHVDGRVGVWVIDDADDMRFAPLVPGASDLDGRVQVLDGLAGGERIIVHSARSVGANSRLRIVEQLAGAGKAAGAAR